MNKMTTLRVALSKRSYNIHISSWNLKHSVGVLKSLLVEDRLFILTNALVAKRYRGVVDKAFSSHFKTEWIVIGDGERFKTLATVEQILTELSKRGATRNSFLLGLGGGVVGDIAGFVAAIYMRGIDFAQMPTTLLSQVDSSVGGKTGVDLKTGKNLAGAFYQPKAVFIHTDFLKTLPRREFLCGLAEVIKYGVIRDEKFFAKLEKNASKILTQNAREIFHLIRRSLEIKAEIVAQDEKEASLRVILNYGHTLGHAIEMLTGFSRIKHGEAVAMGMVFAAQLSYEIGKCSQDVPERVTGILKTYGLPSAWPKISPSKYVAAIRKDKKASTQNIKFILPTKIGKVDIVPLPAEVIKKCL